MEQNVSHNFETATFAFSGQNWSLCYKTIVLYKCCISYSNESAASEERCSNTKLFLSFLEEVIPLILLLAVNKLEKKAQ